MQQRSVLNVGGGSKRTALPPHFQGFEHLLLDIDPSGGADVVCDARSMATLEPERFDAIHNSHNLEHYYHHDVPKVLGGFLHVLKPGGFAHIIVPDMQAVLRMAVERKLDIEDALYQSPSGPISVMDVIYGYGKEIAETGQEFYAHKTGFTEKSLLKALRNAGFSRIYSGAGNLEVVAYAFKGEPDPGLLQVLKLA